MNGVIYILTNPSFPNYIKIGYADDMSERLKQLNNSECTPFAFRVYATYEVDNRLTDVKLHNLIDKLNPTLRSIDIVDGKKRIREFYAMSAEDAYEILEAIAEIHGLQNRLKRYTMTEKETAEQNIADAVTRSVAESFRFSLCGIPLGEKITYCKDESLICTVYDDTHVEYDGDVYSLTALAKKFSNVKSSLAGPRYFKYKGQWLNDLRKHFEENLNEGAVEPAKKADDKTVQIEN